MARPLRIEFPGALYHVTSRGDNKARIFFNDPDRKKFLSIYSEVCSRLHWRTYAWCLMGNHFHLVVETPEPNLSEGMRILNGTYTQYVNRAYGRTGHLFQGRFHAILVDRNPYLLEVIRYVVLNPVRAKLTVSPQDWPWSSYRATVGLQQPPEWLDPGFALDAVSERTGTLEDKRAFFAAYVEAGIHSSRSPMEDLRQQIYLGDEQFVAQAQEKVRPEASLSDVIREQKRPPLEALEDFERTYPDRKEAMARAYLSGQFSQAEISLYFGVHTSSVSKAVRSFRRNSIHTVKITV
jgi:REP element-mobilizing transposase RayT